jgi:pyruvate dehydrogenase E1 component alpha subunit
MKSPSKGSRRAAKTGRKADMTTTAKPARVRIRHKASGEFLPEGVGGEHTVATFEVRYRRYLDGSGKPVAELPDFAADRELMTAFYRAMVLTRTFDIKAISLQRTGQLGTYPSCQGQEAIGVAVAAAMVPDDVLLTTYREQAARLWRGVTLKELFQFWGGDERGNDYSGPREDFPDSIPIGTHATHAVGVATAMKLRRQPRVAVCMLGDGATSKGDFYESVNLAGVWRLPVLFVVSNNQWAISVPRRAQSAAETLAQKAIAGGFEGVQVDGNDAIAVFEAAKTAIDRARAGGGPGLIEALSYRLGDHTTADDATRYRNDEEVTRQWANDPVARLRAYLGAKRWWSKTDEEALINQCKGSVEAAKDEYLAIVPEAACAMFDSLYETLPPAMAWQRKIAEDESDA